MTEVAPEIAAAVEEHLLKKRVAQLVETKDDETGEYAVTDWTGEEDWPIFLGYPHEANLAKLPWSLRYVRYDPETNCGVYVRGEPAQVAPAEEVPLADKEIGELLQIAIGLGIDPLPAQKPALVAAIEAKQGASSVEPAKPTPPTPPAPESPLLAKTVEDLKKMAEQLGITPVPTNKPALVAAIEAKQGAK